MLSRITLVIFSARYELTLSPNRMVELESGKRVNRSQWGAPAFIIHKKDGTVRFISDFEELNKRIKQPYPIQDQNLLLSWFRHVARSQYGIHTIISN
jgi:hypothetical protein